MYKVTIKSHNETLVSSVADEDAIGTEDVARLCYLAMIANGFSPKSVAEWFIETGESELVSLNPPETEDE